MIMAQDGNPSEASQRREEAHKRRMVNGDGGLWRQAARNNSDDNSNKSDS